MAKFNSFKFLTNSWIITLSGTLIGVFAALYLNEWAASKNLSSQKSIATENIITEMFSNKDNLEKSVYKHVEMFETLKFLKEHLDEEDNLIVSSEEMGAFRTKHPSLVILTDSILLSSGDYKYIGEINLNMNLPHLNLTNIAWKTLKSSGFSSTYGFECLMFLETIDKVKTEIIQKNEELLDLFMGAKKGGIKNELLIKHLKLLIDLETSLIKIYKTSKGRIETCD